MKPTDRDGAPLAAVDAEDAWAEATSDPLERQRIALVYLEAAREEWKRQARHWSRVRAEAIQELKQGRTWAQVGDLLGVSEPTAWNIAHPKG